MFDETKAIEYIRKSLPEDIAALYDDDDELLNIIDMIWDFYELNGMLEIDADDDDDSDELVEDIVEYVAKTLRKDKDAHVRPEDVPAIVRAELEYEASLDDEL